MQPSFRKALEQEGFGPSGREQLKAFRDAEVHRLHEFVHEIGIDRKAGQTNDIKDMREYKDAMEYIENRKSNQIVKMQREEKAHEEKDARARRACLILALRVLSVLKKLDKDGAGNEKIACFWGEEDAVKGDYTGGSLVAIFGGVDLEFAQAKN